MHFSEATTEELSERATGAPARSVPHGQRLRDRGELLGLLAESVPGSALFTMDTQGCVLGWNAGAERILGYPEAEIVGQPYACLFTPEEVRQGIPERALRRAALHGWSEDQRWQVRKDGGRFWAVGTMTALRDGEGRLRGYGVVMADGNDHKQLQEALRGQLEALVEADRRKNEFLAVLAHELCSPLSVIQLSLRPLRRSGQGDLAVRAAEEAIREQVAHILRLLDDLLDVTRISQGKVALRKERVSLGAVVEQAVEASLSLIESRSHRLAVVVPPEPVYLEADPVRLQQVLVNLLNNAAKYTELGGQVWLTATIEGEEAVVRVRDTGIGIPAGMLVAIFDLFTQVGHPEARSQRGLGIGLAVVRDLVQLHGGTVQVRSEGLGKGSEFMVRLPTREGHKGAGGP